MLPKSVPPPGSVRHAEAKHSPRAIAGSQRLFCASLPLDLGKHLGLCEGTHRSPNLALLLVEIEVRHARQSGFSHVRDPKDPPGNKSGGS